MEEIDSTKLSGTSVTYLVTNERGEVIRIKVDANTTLTQEQYALLKDSGHAS